ncbi:MAG: hypothetical protein K0R57_5684 [Paenibacillaceae bacterium]|jgi:hypothetical protein|nr:hypothetical protein [Paenibacillaceae bacterium]
MERLIRAGKVIPKHSSQVAHSRIGIGFEKLDRDVFDPEKAYDKVAQLGLKWVRIQSGWAKTEKTKGAYDFAWLDSIVDNLIRRGLVPWVCLCYGNGLYDERAAQVFGAVGCPPIHTEEAKTAWSRYVEALTSHFAGRVEYYEVWNEPDGVWCWKHGPNASEYGRFVIDTARAIKRGDAAAKVIGGSQCQRNLHYMAEAFETGMGEYIDALTFHEYTAREERVFERVRALRALAGRYNPAIEIIQGESGSQSRSGGSGALRTGAWTPRKQAKQLVRHTLADLISDVKFASYFSCMDMIEALNGIVGNKDSYLDYGYFGVLGADFDENGVATGDYTPKLSYTALQTVASVFAGDFTVAGLPVLFAPTVSERIFGRDLEEPSVISSGFTKPNGSSAFVYWNPTDLMTTEFESTVSLQTAALPGDVKLIDLLDGTVYRFPESMLEATGKHLLTFRNIPIKDYPLLLTFGDF